jgi:hypothetical protein
MAGLLDIFGTGGADTMGLLGMSQADIARNRDDAQAQALYALAGRLFQGGNTGQSIAEGLQQGQKAYRGGMQETLQNQLQNVQLADMIRKRKLEQQQLAEQQRIQGVIQGATKPQEIYGEDIMGQRQGEGITAPRFNLQQAIPQLVGSPEGRKTLAELVAFEKAMRPDTFSLAEGATQFERDPFTGQTKTIATGLPKKEKEDIAGEVKEARQILGITTPVDSMTVTERALIKAYIDRKESLKAPKVQVDLKDPTAVAKAQLDTMGKWESYLKNSGDDIVSNRLGAFNDAFKQAKAGNTSGDGAMLYNLAKIYDSSGAVQANDINAIIGSRSIPTQIKLAAQKFKDGGTFTPEERENLKKIATGVATERNKQLQPSLEAYRKLNTRLGGEDSSILNPYERVLKEPKLEEILGFVRPRGGQ